MIMNMALHQISTMNMDTSIYSAASMKTLVYILIVSIQVSISQSQGQAGQGVDDLVKRCPPSLLKSFTKAAEWERCYEFHSEERTWTQANSVCQRNGGHLVTIKEERIQNFLYKALVDYRWPRNGVWIGATDKAKEMDWRWITGERVIDGYSKWARGQPSCGIFCMEDCALMMWKESGRWHDYHCSLFEEYSFICEYAMLPKPTTTTTTTPKTSTTTSTLAASSDTTTVTETTTTVTESATSTGLPKLLGEYRVHKVLVELEETTTTVTSTELPNLGVYGVHVELEENNVSAEFGLNSAQSGHLHESSFTEKKGLLVAIIITAVSGTLVCLALFILVRRRQRKNLKEVDDGISYANPYYGEAKPLTAETPSAECANDSKAEEIKNFVPQDHSDDEQLLSPPKRVMNIYDKPPTRSVPVQKVSQSQRSKEVKASMDENYYDEVRSNAGKSISNYDTPRSLKESEDTTCLESQYYNYQEENIYESLENLQKKFDE